MKTYLPSVYQLGGTPSTTLSVEVRPFQE